MLRQNKRVDFDSVGCRRALQHSNRSVLPLCPTNENEEAKEVNGQRKPAVVTIVTDYLGAPKRSMQMMLKKESNRLILERRAGLM